MKILHINYNIKQNRNVGDEAHVLAIQDSLHTLNPAIEFINVPIYAIAKRHVPKFMPHGERYPRLFHSASRIIKGIGTSKLRSIMKNVDAIIVGGGGLYIDSLLPFDNTFISQLDKPLIIYGVGYNANLGSQKLDDESLVSIKEIGKKATLQSVRDLNTQLFLKKLGIKSELIGDPAMFMSDPRPPVRKMYTKKTLYIGLNIAAHGWKNSATHIPVVVDSYRAALLALKDTYRFECVYFKHHAGEDAVIAQLIKSGVPIKKIIDADARATNQSYKPIDFCISMMLHSCILAFGNNVPVICVGYDEKNKAFMELTNQGDMLIPVEQISAKRLEEGLIILVNELYQRKLRLYKRYQVLQQKSDKFAKQVLALIEKANGIK